MTIEAWFIWALLAALFGALTTILAKAGLVGVNPDAAQFVRTIVVLATIAPLILISGKWSSIPTWNARTWAYILSSGIASCASWLCYFRALEVGRASLVASVDKLSLVLIAILAFTLNLERPTMPGVCGIALITPGLLFISASK